MALTTNYENLGEEEGGATYKSCAVQDFMKVYEILREELLTDDLIAGQPSFSAEYMRKVRASTDPSMSQVTGDVQYSKGHQTRPADLP